MENEKAPDAPKLPPKDRKSLTPMFKKKTKDERELRAAAKDKDQ